MRYRIPVVRELYADDEPEHTTTVLGTIDIDALSAEQAISVLEAMMAFPDPLQTTDPRIAWDYDDLPYDPEYGCVDGYSYVDFSFERNRDELIEIV